jgi:hypothetical protein
VNDDLMNFKANIWGAALDLLEKGNHERIVCIAQNAHAARPGVISRISSRLFAAASSAVADTPGDIATRPGNVADQPGRNWIACHHDNGNVVGRIFCRIGGRRLHRDDHIDTAANQFRRGNAKVVMQITDRLPRGS